jgi:hypothetical protein
MSEFDFNAVVDEAGPETAPEVSDASASTESVPNYAPLDAVLPDADDVDADFRGKPIAEVLRVAKQHKEEAKKGYEKAAQYNDLESELRMQRALNEVLRRQSTPQPQAAPPPDNERFLQRFAENPTQVLPEEIQRHVAPMVAQLTEKLREMEWETVQTRAESARDRARVAAGLDTDTWNALRQPIASFMAARGADPTNESEWFNSFQMYKSMASKLVPRTEIATPSAPPAGQARSVSRPSSTPRLSARDEKNLERLAAGMGIKKDTPAWTTLVTEIAAGGNE